MAASQHGRTAVAERVVVAESAGLLRAGDDARFLDEVPSVGQHAAVAARVGPAEAHVLPMSAARKRGWASLHGTSACSNARGGAAYLGGERHGERAVGRDAHAVRRRLGRGECPAAATVAAHTHGVRERIHIHIRIGSAVSTGRIGTSGHGCHRW